MRGESATLRNTSSRFPMRRTALLVLPLLLAACGSAPAPEAAGGTEVRTSLNGLMKLGKDYACTFSGTDEDGTETEGDVKVASNGQRMRGEFVITKKDGTVTRGNIIHDGERAYVWDGAEKRGMVMDIPESERDAGAAAAMPLGQDDAMGFRCEGWTPAKDSFAPPADIEFADLSAQMKAAMGTVGGFKSEQCAACARMPDAASKAQCEQAMEC